MLWTRVLQVEVSGFLMFDSDLISVPCPADTGIRANLKILGSGELH